MTVPRTGPLTGIRVLDLSSMLAGPYCGRWLADLGADVIKVESPDGDYMRTRPPLRNGRSAYFGHLNAGKRSVVIDLKHPDGCETLRALAARVDVLLEGFRPGVMKRLGLDYPALAADCPRLVYCSISGYGQTGPQSQAPAYAAIVHAASGFDLAWQSCQPAGSPLSACAVQIADVTAASFATIGIQSALLERTRTGRGQQVDLSLMEGMLAMMPLDIVQAQFPDDSPRTVYRPLRARDTDFIVTPISVGNFRDLCTAIGQPQLLDDPRFATPMARVRHWDALLAVIQRWASQRTAAECVRVLDAAGVPASLYARVDEAIDAPQVAHRRFVRNVRDRSGPFRAAGLPFALGGDAGPPACPDGQPGAEVAGAAVPELGQHTVQVLRELLGTTRDDIDRLVAARAICAADACDA